MCVRVRVRSYFAMKGRVCTVLVLLVLVVAAAFVSCEWEQEIDEEDRGECFALVPPPLSHTVKSVQQLWLT